MVCCKPRTELRETFGAQAPRPLRQFQSRLVSSFLKLPLKLPFPCSLLQDSGNSVLPRAR